ncbi:hypothetical protein COEREDRAFT_84296 [Coemansia reversa NRRL 1564]|uniref:Uncharacterized protein n=1 Tax=Coemansia reversa (strain ATCC 12441 / NRRL 1564) TaxID=763665 RepID=A0A2G5BLU6_COERN|nr:hypothetical protein COEREDRAFT_84296 [Coemansia reversa NRRL 1564]|eukprot:PIA19677.1 hypothetical protein COEREDRAFT_84296 [Coemansia reversa NRRL 1564]
MFTQDSGKKELTAAVITGTSGSPVHLRYEGKLTYEKVVEKISNDLVTRIPGGGKGFLCGIPNSVEAWVSDGDTIEVSFFEPDDSGFVWVDKSDVEDNKSQPDDNSQEIQEYEEINKPTNTSELSFSQCEAFYFYFYFYPPSEKLNGYFTIPDFVSAVTESKHKSCPKLSVAKVKYRVCSELLQYCSISFEDEKLSDEVKNQLRDMNTGIQEIQDQCVKDIKVEYVKF